MQREPYGVGVRVGKVGQRFALPDALAKDEIKPLSGAFDQSAFTQDLGDTANARILFPEDVLRSDAGRKDRQG